MDLEVSITGPQASTSKLSVRKERESSQLLKNTLYQALVEPSSKQYTSLLELSVTDFKDDDSEAEGNLEGGSDVPPTMSAVECEATEHENDFWSMSGDFFHSHHVARRD